jgi:hypothetical protein
MVERFEDTIREWNATQGAPLTLRSAEAGISSEAECPYGLYAQPPQPRFGPKCRLEVLVSDSLQSRYEFLGMGNAEGLEVSADERLYPLVRASPKQSAGREESKDQGNDTESLRLRGS